jgi:hypothetical protein
MENSMPWISVGSGTEVTTEKTQPEQKGDEFFGMYERQLTESSNATPPWGGHC